MPAVIATVDFTTPKLAEAVEGLAEEQIDALPFGAIRLDAGGNVIYYSKAERNLSRSGDLQRVGKRFFTEVAPCMDNENYRGRIELAIERGTLDLEFTHIGDFADRDRELTVRIQSASDGGYWIFMRRES